MREYTTFVKDEPAHKVGVLCEIFTGERYPAYCAWVSAPGAAAPVRAGVVSGQRWERGRTTLTWPKKPPVTTTRPQVTTATRHTPDGELDVPDAARTIAYLPDMFAVRPATRDTAEDTVIEFVILPPKSMLVTGDEAEFDLLLSTIGALSKYNVFYRADDYLEVSPYIAAYSRLLCAMLKGRVSAPVMPGAAPRLLTLAVMLNAKACLWLGSRQNGLFSSYERCYSYGHENVGAGQPMHFYNSAKETERLLLQVPREIAERFGSEWLTSPDLPPDWSEVMEAIKDGK